MRNHVLCALLLSHISLGAAEPVPPREKATPIPLCDSFEQFLKAFVDLFKKETLKEGIEEIEQMTKHLLQTAFGIMNGKSTIRRKAPTQKPADQEENAKKILILFAGILKNFLNIVQNPENKDNVVPNLMGMAEGMVEIGSEVMKRSTLTADADMQLISTYVEQQLNLEIKQAMLAIATQKAEELRLMAHVQ